MGNVLCCRKCCRQCLGRRNKASVHWPDSVSECPGLLAKIHSYPSAYESIEGSTEQSASSGTTTRSDLQESTPRETASGQTESAPKDDKMAVEVVQPRRKKSKRSSPRKKKKDSSSSTGTGQSDTRPLVDQEPQVRSLLDYDSQEVSSTAEDSPMTTPRPVSLMQPGSGLDEVDPETKEAVEQQGTAEQGAQGSPEELPPQLHYADPDTPEKLAPEEGADNQAN